jgi:hypothetical protein
LNGANSVIVAAGGCYGFNFTDNIVQVSNSTYSGVFSFASPVVATISGNRIRADKMSADNGDVVAPVVANSVVPNDLTTFLLNVSNNAWEIDRNLLAGPVPWGTYTRKSGHAGGWFIR